MRYYHISLPNGTQLGPYDQATLQHMVMTGQIPRDCMAWTEGQGSWLPLEQVIHIPAAPPMAPNNPQHPLFEHYQAAMQGNVESQYYMACCHLNGEHTTKDAAAAVHWLQAAANQNHYAACITLANCYGNGVGVKSNPETALAWCQKAQTISDTKEVRELITTYTEKAEEAKFTFFDGFCIFALVLLIIFLFGNGSIGNEKGLVAIGFFGLRGIYSVTKLMKKMNKAS